MVDDSERREAARKPLEELVTFIARNSARVSCEMGVEFDVDDPRVARWLMLATFEGMFMPSAKSTSAELLAKAAKASEGESRMAPRKKKKGQRTQPLITWGDLIASVDVGSGQKA